MMTAATKRIGAVGYWSGLAAFAATVAYVVVQLLQVMGLLRFPLDEILIYGTSLCIVIPFVLEMLSLHYLTQNDKQFWTHAALIFTTIYAVFVIANYVVQLATVIPAKAQGTAEAISVLEQTPHSMFWDYDAIGYIAMGLAALVAVPAIGNVGFEKWVRLSHRPRSRHSTHWYRVFLSDVLRQASLSGIPLGHYSARVHADAGNNVAEKAYAEPAGVGCLNRRGVRQQ